MSNAWRAFSANIPVYASWDDHDDLNNDQSGLQKGQITDQERHALRALWQEHWVNPPTAVEDRGLYFNTVIGDVELIMLDTRSYRNWKKKGSRGAYLGDEQMEWLFKTLKASEATSILLTSGTMWNDFVSKAKDSWGVWDIPGREEIFDYLEENQIGGVPGSAAFAPDRSAQLYRYSEKLIAFGELSFDMSESEPEVAFRLIDEKETILEEHKFSDLGVAETKIKKRSLISQMLRLGVFSMVTANAGVDIGRSLRTLGAVIDLDRWPSGTQAAQA